MGIEILTIAAGVGIVSAIGAITAGGVVYSNKVEREAAKAKVDYEAGQTKIRTDAEAYSRDTALGKLDLELKNDKENAYTKAGDLETSAKTGFTGAMEKTFLGQLAAESNLLDFKAQGAQAIGGVEAAAGARGLRAPTTTKQVLESNIRDQVNLSRKQIDSGRDLSVSQNQANLGLNLKNADEMRTQFDPGSAYMDLYDFTKTRIAGSSDIALSALASQSTYLGDLSKSYNYNEKWFLTDLFDVANVGLKTFGTATSWGLL